ncbi:PAS domain-containing protein [Marinomonas sp. A79]|uniref:PAS domain-containing protein n=1 Tax=Marinomonas vulgaris TaxID=2823372 RepID=A0ABS5H9U8_9GAMM|nr:PAS domain S-box protein [Marinomonas vulgaris]MBR7888217.1 PAS domain-containing protein [Marinomonas vulgaris]
MMIFRRKAEKKVPSKESGQKDNQCSHELLAIQQNTACISFNTDGIILEANPLFLNAVGYELHEVIGQHHRLFCDSEYARSADYKQFWNDLKAGKANNGTFFVSLKTSNPSI